MFSDNNCPVLPQICTINRTSALLLNFNGWIYEDLGASAWSSFKIGKSLHLSHLTNSVTESAGFILWYAQVHSRSLWEWLYAETWLKEIRNILRKSLTSVELCTNLSFILSRILAVRNTVPGLNSCAMRNQHFVTVMSRYDLIEHYFEKPGKLGD